MLPTSQAYPKYWAQVGFNSPPSPSASSVSRSSGPLNYPTVPTILFCPLNRAHYHSGTPYLISLGLSKSAIAIVFLAGPLSGLIVQPLIGMSSTFSSVLHYHPLFLRRSRRQLQVALRSTETIHACRRMCMCRCHAHARLRPSRRLSLHDCMPPHPLVTRHDTHIFISRMIHSQLRSQYWLS